MFRIVGSSVSIVIVMNFMALTLLSLLLGWFSAPIFGLAFFVIGIFVLITSPGLNWGEKRFSVPVFPGKDFFKFALGIVVLLAVVYATVGEGLVSSWKGKADLKKTEMVFENKVFSIEPGIIFLDDEYQHPRRLVRKDRGFYLSEKTSDPTRETLLKFRLGDFRTGPIRWIPISLVEKPEKIEKQKDKQVSRGNESILSRSNWKEVKDWFGSSGKAEPKPRPSEPASVREIVIVSLTPMEIERQDLHKSWSRLLLNFEELKKGDMIELIEDFSWQVAGENPQSWLFIGGKKAEIELVGSCQSLKKGTRFVFLGKHSNLALTSTGNQRGFSGLKFKKIKNLL